MSKNALFLDVGSDEKLILNWFINQFVSCQTQLPVNRKTNKTENIITKYFTAVNDITIVKILQMNSKSQQVKITRWCISTVNHMVSLRMWPFSVNIINTIQHLDQSENCRSVVLGDRMSSECHNTSYEERWRTLWKIYDGRSNSSKYTVLWSMVDVGWWRTCPQFTYCAMKSASYKPQEHHEHPAANTNISTTENTCLLVEHSDFYVAICYFQASAAKRLCECKRTHN